MGHGSVAWRAVGAGQATRGQGKGVAGRPVRRSCRPVGGGSASAAPAGARHQGARVRLVTRLPGLGHRLGPGEGPAHAPALHAPGQEVGIGALLGAQGPGGGWHLGRVDLSAPGAPASGVPTCPWTARGRGPPGDATRTRAGAAGASAAPSASGAGARPSPLAGATGRPRGGERPRARGGRQGEALGGPRGRAAGPAGRGRRRGRRCAPRVERGPGVAPPGRGRRPAPDGSRPAGALPAGRRRPRHRSRWPRHRPRPLTEGGPGRRCSAAPDWPPPRRAGSPRACRWQYTCLATRPKCGRGCPGVAPPPAPSPRRRWRT